LDATFSSTIPSGNSCILAPKALISHSAQREQTEKTELGAE
jgi:hypothetical protein